MMAVTSFYKEHGNRWLTSFGPNAVEGSEHTISVGHPLYHGQFCTYRLAAPVAVNQWGENLFDETECFVEFDSGEWLTLAEVRDLVGDDMAMKARSYIRNGFWQWVKAA